MSSALPLLSFPSLLQTKIEDERKDHGHSDFGISGVAGLKNGEGQEVFRMLVTSHPRSMGHRRAML